MQTNDPNNPSQQPSQAPGPDSQAQLASVPRLSSVQNMPQPGAAPNVPQAGYPYVAQPGYPYTVQYAQPGYSQPVAHVPSTPGAGVPMFGPVPVTPAAQTAAPQTQASAPAKPARSKGRSAAIFALTCLLAVVFGVGIFSGWTFARSSIATNPNVASSTSPSKTVSTALDSQIAREAAIAKVTPAVVEVIGQVSQGTALGSGVIIDKNGDIITNYHVVEGTSSLQVVLSDGRAVAAQLVGTDAANDLAVLHIQPYSGMQVATLGDSSKLTIGQEVLAIGNPLGYSGTATSGVVSALNRNAQETRSVRLTGLIQISTPINPGNSGGALINLQGEVVGIPTLSAVNSETNTPANGIGFAIPSSQVKSALTQILG
ncbi:MAG TPA: trypsin-like peptidase domain-containing protein [Ktedonobacteraceae bacterium]